MRRALSRLSGSRQPPEHFFGPKCCTYLLPWSCSGSDTEGQVSSPFWTPDSLFGALRGGLGSCRGPTRHFVFPGGDGAFAPDSGPALTMVVVRRIAAGGSGEAPGPSPGLVAHWGGILGCGWRSARGPPVILDWDGCHRQHRHPLLLTAGPVRARIALLLRRSLS